MTNYKMKFVKSAAALALGASVITSAVVAGDLSASAKTTYKVSKGKLVNAKTKKAIKGYKVYKSVLYKDGKKFTGLHSKRYYKAGVKATGTYKGAYYVKGVKKIETGTYKGVYYKKGVKATGYYKKAYYVKGKKVVDTGIYNGKFYKDGKLNIGLALYQDKLYKDTKLNKGLVLFQDKLYKDTALNKDLVLYQDKLYKDAELNKGLVKYEDKYYFDAELANGTYKDENGVEKLYKDGTVVDLAVESVKAVTAKTLEVKFNQAVNVTAADFSVAKGSVKSNVANVVIAEDKKSAQIELTSKLTKGDYTVSVKNGEQTLTGTVTADDEKVAGIQVLSDNAVLSGVTDNDGKTTATVGVQISNQYGEDVTKLNAGNVNVNVSGVATSGTLNPNGTLTLEGITASTVKEGDNIIVTLVNGATATTTTKTVKVSAKSVASSVEVGTLYNKDGKTLSQDTDFSADKFYLPITVKDQYGKEITDADKANNELLITNTNSAVAAFADNNEIKEVTIDGKDVLALQVSSVNLAGTTNVLAISKANGTSAQGTVTVKDGVKIASATLSAPTALVTANKDTYFPLSVVDSEGKEVTTKKALDAINDTVTVTGGTIEEVEGKGLFVKVDHESVVANSPLTVVVNTSTGKVSTQTVVPKAEAVATVVTGISADKATALRQGKSVTIANTDLVIEDQYGQVIKSENNGDVLFKAFASDDTPFTVTNVEGNKSVTIAAKSDYAGAKTSDKLDFKLLDATDAHNAIEASTFTKTFTVVSDSTFASYKVEDVAPIYVTANEAGVYRIVDGYDKDVVVKATSKSGDVVTLDEDTDYSVTGKDASKIKFATGSDTATQTVTVTINSTGEQFTKEITYSKAEAKPAKVELVGPTVDATATKYDLVSKKEITETTAVNAAAIEKLLNVLVTDQYGVKAVDAADTITFTKVSGNATFTGNGTADAKITSAEDGAVVNATINVGGQKATVQLTLTNGITAE
ncbi:hypothetical protein [Rummeliibacillus sp. POC4]|uniref:hypothetical protein n=1 Tax=Rummeliibacillus sp. POC4 TaxID=2305899 RepID=UPI000E673F74|nr:hypothetical protein [Rummeliibacillus sp. POC4]RIJ63899.1 hypothetical protein D1606_12645 [Rummeliibacillus sp. POC4]